MVSAVRGKTAVTFCTGIGRHVAFAGTLHTRRGHVDGAASARVVYEAIRQSFDDAHEHDDSSSMIFQSLDHAECWRDVAHRQEPAEIIDHALTTFVADVINRGDATRLRKARDQWLMS